ncbi:MAG: DUF1616 domain-containing protein [Candidatus Bathyarchaeota archaeon]|nr:MAG: DUF1616 domain-containing protein [Candidatus Bathyarchaeota archaeon]
MSFDERKLLFFTASGILMLLVVSPALNRFFIFPRTEFFTELWLLGPNQKAEGYPFNVTVNEKYEVFLGMANHLGYAAYYNVAVKFRNETQPYPDNLNYTPSSLLLSNIYAFVLDKGIWELPLRFSFSYTYNETLSQVKFHTMQLNDAVLGMENYVLFWNSERKGFFGNLFFELWIYNTTARGFLYHGRFVSLWFNLTSTKVGMINGYS